MKKILTLLFALSAAVYTQAQMPAHYKFAKTQGAPSAFVAQLLNSQMKMAAKTTLTKERLIGSRYYTNDFRPSLNIYDSSKYIYSGNNGSQYDLNELQYDFPKTQFDNNQPMLDLHGYHITQPEVHCDSAIGKNVGTSGLELSNTTTATYDANGMLLTYKSLSVDTTYTPSLSYYNTYDGSGNVTASIYFKTPNGTAWDSVTRRYFTYNGAGQLTADSTYTHSGSSWYVSKKYTYSYDGGGHLIQVNVYGRDSATGTMKNTAVYNQTYYAGGNLQTCYISSDTGTGLYVSAVDTFGYATGYSYYNFFQESSYTDVGWSIVSTASKHINAAGVPDSSFRSELIFFYDTSGVLLGSQIVHFKDKISYNTHNDPVKDIDYIDFGSGYGLNSTQYFYYEPATGVANAPVQYEVKVYPNPTADYVNILPNDAVKNKNIVLQLTNAAGRLMSSRSVNWTGQEIKMPLTNLVSGVYYLSVRDASGSAYMTEKVVKE